MRTWGALVGGLLLLLVVATLLQWVIAEHPSLFVAGCVLLVCAAVFAGTRWKKLEAANALAEAEALQADMRAIAAQYGRRGEKAARLLSKYRDRGIVDRLMTGMPWDGMTRDMLIDLAGPPVRIDRVTKKSVDTEVYIYERKPVRGFRRRVTLTDGVVNGWEIRGEKAKMGTE